MTVLLIEHNMQITMNLCDRLVVLDRGEKIAEGLPNDIRNNERVISAYLGSDD
jgi:branched-chain amino acid transport system ATP-binding protein